jgi:hypothetical protein
MKSYKYPVTDGGVEASGVCKTAPFLGSRRIGKFVNPHEKREIGSYDDLGGGKVFLRGKCIFLLIFGEKIPRIGR